MKYQSCWLQDPSLALEVVSPEEKTDEAKENTLMPTLVPPLEVDEIDKTITESEVGSNSKNNNQSTWEKPRLKRRKRKNVRKLKTDKNSSAKDDTTQSDPIVCADFDYDAVTSTWNCDVCQLSFAESVELAKHLNTHADLKRFRCEVCGLRFTKK